MTNDSTTISNESPYIGSDGVLKGNEGKILITCIGESITFGINYLQVYLNHVLHVLYMFENLILVSKLCRDNQVFIEIMMFISLSRKQV